MKEITKLTRAEVLEVIKKFVLKDVGLITKSGNPITSYQQLIGALGGMSKSKAKKMSSRANFRLGSLKRWEKHAKEKGKASKTAVAVKK